MSVPAGACLVCGAKIVYLKKPELMICEKCGKSMLSNAQCENGHFICDSCHSEAILEKVWRLIEDCISKNPIEIIDVFMDQPETHMHGPEHHALVPVALLVAYRNSGGQIDDLKAAVKEALRRGKQVPGGFCGFWGTCGAAVGSGIFLSVALDCSPLKQDHYGDINRITARGLEHIAQIGGPRCCKRNSYICIEESVRYVHDFLGVTMDIPLDIKCCYHANNHECLQTRCPFFDEAIAIETFTDAG